MNANNLQSKLLAMMKHFRLVSQFTHLDPSKRLRNPASQSHLNQIQKDAMISICKRIPIYLTSVLGIITIGTITHFNDDCFPYYPFPFAIDVGDGPSMLPTMFPGDVYWRDCWSDRFIWLNWRHLAGAFGLMSNGRNLDGSVFDISTTTYKRPWQRGDVTTIFNPYSKTIICKRIIGLEGDTIQVFGEYAQSYQDVYEECGVPTDPRYATPFCKREAMKQNNETSKSCYQTTITVPPNHVWVEGDNPLYSTDSRHFGPLPIISLRGRITLRLWPLRRFTVADNSIAKVQKDGIVSSWCALSPKRPYPFMSVDEILKDERLGVKRVDDEANK